MKKSPALVLEVVGAVLVVIAALCASVVAGVLIAGVLCLLFGVAAELGGS